MKFSTKGKYGLKAMFELALRYGEEPISLNLIAENQNISLNYLEQIIAKLKKDGLVKSYRGAHGGYKLSMQPSEITLSMILNSLEGEITLSECLAEEDNICENIHSCVTRPIWKKINESIYQVIDHMTLQDMLDENNKEKI